MYLAREEQRRLPWKPRSPTLLFAMHQAMPGDDLKRNFLFWVHPSTKRNKWSYLLNKMNSCNKNCE